MYKRISYIEKGFIDLGYNYEDPFNICFDDNDVSGFNPKDLGPFPFKEKSRQSYGICRSNGFNGDNNLAESIMLSEENGIECMVQ